MRQARNLFAALFLMVLAAAAGAQEKVDQRRPASPDGLVTISNVAGSITVRGWDKAEVAVTGTLGKNTEELEFEVTGDRTTIEVILPKNIKNVDGSDLEIRVPARSRVEVDTVSADIDVSDVSGRCDLETVSGNVKCTGSPSELESESVSGSIHLQAEARRITADSVSGKISIEGQAPDEVSAETVSGEISYQGGLGRSGSLKASSVSGEVELTLPSNLSAEFNASTFSGGIRNDFKAAEASPEKEHSKGRLRFTTGSGGARVEVETFSGGITFRTK